MITDRRERACIGKLQQHPLGPLQGVVVRAHATSTQRVVTLDAVMPAASPTADTPSRPQDACQHVITMSASPLERRVTGACQTGTQAHSATSWTAPADPTNAPRGAKRDGTNNTITSNASTSATNASSLQRFINKRRRVRHHHPTDTPGGASTPPSHDDVASQRTKPIPPPTHAAPTALPTAMSRTAATPTAMTRTDSGRNACAGVSDGINEVPTDHVNSDTARHVDTALTGPHRGTASAADRTSASLKRFVSRRSNKCAVCLQPLQQSAEGVGVLDCDHTFCLDCIVSWTTVSNACPLCKVRDHWQCMIRHLVGVFWGHMCLLIPLFG